MEEEQDRLGSPTAGEETGWSSPARDELNSLSSAPSPSPHLVTLAQLPPLPSISQRLSTPSLRWVAAMPSRPSASDPDGTGQAPTEGIESS